MRSLMKRLNLRWQEAKLRAEIRAIEHNRSYLLEVLRNGPAELDADEKALRVAMHKLAVLTDKALPTPTAEATQ